MQWLACAWQTPAGSCLARMSPTTHVLGSALRTPDDQEGLDLLTRWINATLLPPADAVSHAERTAADAADEVCVLAAILNLRPGAQATACQ